MYAGVLLPKGGVAARVLKVLWGAVRICQRFGMGGRGLAAISCKVALVVGRLVVGQQQHVVTASGQQMRDNGKGRGFGHKLYLPIQTDVLVRERSRTKTAVLQICSTADRCPA